MKSDSHSTNIWMNHAPGTVLAPGDIEMNETDKNSLSSENSGLAMLTFLILITNIIFSSLSIQSSTWLF